MKARATVRTRNHRARARVSCAPPSRTVTTSGGRTAGTLHRDGSYAAWLRVAAKIADPQASRCQRFWHAAAVIDFEPATRERLRRRLLQRGHQLATRLAELLAGKLHPTALAVLELRPGKRPEEALREALDSVEARRRLLAAGDDRYGNCDTCGIELGLAALEDMPWADRCPAHADR